MKTFTLQKFPGESGCASKWNNDRSFPTWSAQAWGMLQMNIATKEHWIILWLILQTADKPNAGGVLHLDGRRKGKKDTKSQPGTCWEPHGTA